jgi:hypothetical protein
MGIKKKRKWTVFFLIKSVDDSIDELILMVNEVRSLYFTKEIAVVFCVNIAEQNVPFLLSGDGPEVGTSRVKKTFTTLFLKLEPDDTNGRFPNKLVKFDEKPDFDLTVSEHLTGYFRSHILERFQAKRYMLFTWDHGNAFGIFGRHANPQNDVFNSFDDDGMDPEVFAQLDIVDQVGFKFVTGETSDLLTMEELATSLQFAFGDTKIDIIAMMNCHMQVVDTGFALRDAAKYLVASELYMDFNGYNYPFIFQLMIDDPKISPRKLARHIVSSFKNKIFPRTDLGKFDKSITAISAVELFYFFKFEKFVNRLSEFLITLLPLAYTIINNAREAASLSLTNDLVDVYTFLDKIAEKQQFNDNTLLASLVFSMKEMVIFQTYIGDAFKNENPSEPPSIYRPTGLSVFFPLFATPEGLDRPALENTSFFKNTKWKEFLLHFHTVGQAVPA